jgi:hypothetical protein
VKRPKERPSQTVARLPPRVASPGGTHVVMRLEELTLYPTWIRLRVALAQADGTCTSIQIRSSTPHRILARDSDAMTQASPLRGWKR